MCKLNSRCYLRYGSILSTHAINLLLNPQHAKNYPSHKTMISKLTNKQWSNLKSPIKDINECLNGIRECFNPLFPLFSPGSRVVNHFSSRFSFHSPLSSSDEDLFHHLQNLDQAFRSSQISPHNVTMEKENVHNIIVITDSIAAAKKVFELKTDPLQNMFIPLTLAIDSFFRKDSRNKIQFWFCPSKAKWPKHKLIDNQVKANNCTPIFPSKESHLFNKKKECNNILSEWQNSFMSNPKRGQCFLNFEDENQKVIILTYTKGGSWLPSIGFTNLLCARFTCITTSHAPIREYRQKFLPHLPISYLCSKAKV